MMIKMNTFRYTDQGVLPLEANVEGGIRSTDVELKVFQH